MQTLLRSKLFHSWYADFTIVASTGTIIFLLLELLRPALISGIIDITWWCLLSILMVIAGASFELFPDALDRLQRQFLRVMLITIGVLFATVISLQLAKHLLGLALLAVIVLSYIAALYVFYDS